MEKALNKGVPNGPIDIGSAQKKYPDSAEAIERRRLDEDRLAEDIIEECRVRLMLKFRFLDRALWRMSLKPVRSGMDYPLATDGHCIYYDPQRVIARFRQSFDELIRDYLHLIMHCIFRHPFDRDHKVAEAWSLTCDMVVESVVMDLADMRFSSEDDAQRRNALDQVALQAGSLLPNKVYGFLKDLSRTPSGQQFRGYSRSTLNEWHQLFERDDHHAWPSQSDSLEAGTGDDDARSEMSEDDDNPDAQSDGMQSQAFDDQDATDQMAASADDDDAEGDPNADGSSDSAPDQLGSDSDDGLDDEQAQQHQPEPASSDDANTEDAADPESDPDADDLAADQAAWEDISKEIEMNLETFSKEWGDAAGSLMANLQMSNRRTYDYTDFLRRFMTVTEQIKLNPDEFDYTYYTFGMSLYGNIPFIEPLEYKESESIRDFVIAVDTSESVKGSLVKRFVEHTVSMLAESRDASTKVNIHVVQADSKVQSDLKIGDLRDVDRLMEGFVVRGFGGTDYRPTFDYVQMLRKSGELTDLKGMIYFTDGFGSFPEKPPDYDAAFVFLDDGSREIPPVPPWAMKVVLDEHDVEKVGK